MQWNQQLLNNRTLQKSDKEQLQTEMCLINLEVQLQFIDSEEGNLSVIQQEQPPKKRFMSVQQLFKRNTVSNKKTQLADCRHTLIDLKYSPLNESIERIQEFNHLPFPIPN